MSHRDDEKVDLETQVTTHSCKLEALVPKSSVLDDEGAELHADFGSLSAQMKMDAMRVDEQKISTTTVETAQLQFTYRLVDVPGVLQRRVPTIQRVGKASACAVQ